MSSGSDVRQLKSRRKSHYSFFLEYRTRWSDNDQYAHMNNAVYYHLFDSIINTYLIEVCGMKNSGDSSVGLVVSSYCNFFTPLSFPQVLILGLRVNTLGRSSVTYEVGIFPERSTIDGRNATFSSSDDDVVAAVGGYTHVFVDNSSRKSIRIPQEIYDGLHKLLWHEETSRL
ncbi:Thioesterase/thiol ester dehydrase-isomerase [Fistulina hepatica ATCC 64428]|nr:Thioesterase/thiol ester dehydrase-isomerase [Fistulina hepatica ATCC 64428]